MAYCPNCSIELPPDAESCQACGAEFGFDSAWRPNQRPQQNRAAIRHENSPDLNLFTRLCGTAWMMICVFTVCIFFAVFRIFRPAPLIGGAYILLALYATLQLWTKPKYTTLFLVTALLPLFFIFILPLLSLLLHR